MDKNKSFGIYKANEKSTGSCMQLNITNFPEEPGRKPVCFMMFAKQLPGTSIGHSKLFDYENGINMKFGVNDLATVLRLVLAFTKEIDIIHSFPNPPQDGVETVKTSLRGKANEGQYQGYYFNARREDVGIGCPMTLEEAEVMRLLIEQLIPRMI